MSDSFGMPEVDHRPAYEVIADLRQKLADSQKWEVILRDALVTWLEGSNLSTAIIESEKALAATEPKS